MNDNGFWSGGGGDSRQAESDAYHEFMSVMNGNAAGFDEDEIGAMTLEELQDKLDEAEDALSDLEDEEPDEENEEAYSEWEERCSTLEDLIDELEDRISDLEDADDE